MSNKENKSIASIFGEGGRPKNSKREIKIVDTTFRDAHQSLWATRMRTEHMLGIAETMNSAGFHHIDMMAPIQFDVSVRYLKEDPWVRVRDLHKASPETKFRALIRSKNIASFDFLPDDVIDGWVDQLYNNGFRVIGAFDGLNDVTNIIGCLKRAKALGAYTFGALSFCESPLHTDELFVKTAVELIEQADVDAIMLKDAGGLLTPERIRTLVPAIKEVIGDRPLELHSHCLTGLCPLVYLEAVELGCDILHTSIAPLANGAGQPATQTIVKSLRELGYVVNIDDEKIEEASNYFKNICEVEGKPEGKPAEFNPLHYKHQLPGGMLSNFHAQLETAGLGDRYEELLEEIAQVRKELAWPIMITPFAQFVGTQAVMNVISGERYGTVPNEIKKYVLGYYGRLLGPVDAEVYEKILENGSSEISEKPTSPKPMMKDLAQQHPNAAKDELLLRAMFAGNQVDGMKEAIAKGESGDDFSGGLVSFIKELASGDEKQIKLSTAKLNISISRQS